MITAHPRQACVPVGCELKEVKVSSLPLPGAMHRRLTPTLLAIELLPFSPPTSKSTRANPGKNRTSVICQGACRPRAAMNDDISSKGLSPIRPSGRGALIHNILWLPPSPSSVDDFGSPSPTRIENEPKTSCEATSSGQLDTRCIA